MGILFLKSFLKPIMSNIERSIDGWIDGPFCIHDESLFCFYIRLRCQKILSLELRSFNKKLKTFQDRICNHLVGQRLYFKGDIRWQSQINSQLGECIFNILFLCRQIDLVLKILCSRLRLHHRGRLGREQIVRLPHRGRFERSLD